MFGRHVRSEALLRRRPEDVQGLVDVLEIVGGADRSVYLEIVEREVLHALARDEQWAIRFCRIDVEAPRPLPPPGDEVSQVVADYAPLEAIVEGRAAEYLQLAKGVALRNIAHEKRWK